MNTKDNRASAIHISLPFRGLLPQPGTLDQADRQQIAFMYRGISAGGETPEEPAESEWIIRARRRGRR